MANWTVSQSSITTIQGATVSANVVLTITPNVGFVISASDFKIGEATETSTNVWSGGNVDIGVNTVTFADVTTAGAVGNTVTATVAFDSFSMPSSNKEFFIDIDEKADKTVKNVDRYFCIRTQHVAEANSQGVNKHVVTYASAPTNITTTNNAPLVHNSGNGLVEHLHQGTVPQGVAAPGTLIFSVDFDANETYGYHYILEPTVGTLSGNYSSYYTFINSGHLYDANGNLIFVTVKGYYTPPVGVVGLDPDPASSASAMCELGQSILISHVMGQSEQGGPGDKKYITDVETLNTFINASGETRVVKVVGDIGSVFKLVVTRTGDGHTYDFSTDTFTSGATTSVETTLGNTGIQLFKVLFPSIVSNATYDITIVPTSPTSTLSRVPLVANDLRLYQYINVVVSLDIQGDTGSENVWDDVDFPAPITLTGRAGYTYSEGLKKTFSFTITEAMVTDASIDNIAPKSSLDFTLSSQAFTSQAIDGDVSSATFDVASTSGIVATTPINWSVEKLAVFAEEGTSNIIVGDIPSDPDSSVVKNTDNLTVGMILTSSDIPGGDIVKIETINEASITLDNTITTTLEHPITFTANDVTVSSVTDANTLVASQTLTGVKNELVLTFGGGESDVQAYVSDGTSSQSGDNVILAGNFHVNTFPVTNTIVTIDINELITITDA